MRPGRPTKYGERMRSRTVRLTDEQWDEFNRRGGPEALRNWLTRPAPATKTQGDKPQ